MFFRRFLKGREFEASPHRMELEDTIEAEIQEI
jgi:hypothetical protein